MKAKTLAAALVALTLPLFALTTAPAEAAKSPAAATQKAVKQRITIMTRTATAVGDALDGTPNFVFRPRFTLRARVVCPKGVAGFMRVPVWAHGAPGAFFTCTGRRQTVSFAGTAAPTTPGTARVPVTATLVTRKGRTSHTRRITITTKPRAVKQSILITTRTATAVGDRLDDPPDFVFRPRYTLSATVVCAKGDAGFMRVPVWAMSAPGAFFTCTGFRQTVSFAATAAPTTPGTTTVPVTATLVTPKGETSHTQQITITTTFRS